MLTNGNVYLFFGIQYHFFVVIECVGHSFAYVARFVLLRNSNPESCRSKQARYQLCHIPVSHCLLVSSGPVR
jgi:hypothetical protein